MLIFKLKVRRKEKLDSLMGTGRDVQILHWIVQVKVVYRNCRAILPDMSSARFWSVTGTA